MNEIFRFVLLRAPKGGEEIKTNQLSKKTVFFNELESAALKVNARKAQFELSKTFLAANKKLNINFGEKYQRLYEELMKLDKKPTFNKIHKAIEHFFTPDNNKDDSDKKIIQDKENLSNIVYATKFFGSPQGYNLKDVKLYINTISFIELVYRINSEPDKIQEFLKEIKIISGEYIQKKYSRFSWLNSILKFIVENFESIIGLFTGKKNKEDKGYFSQPGIIDKNLNKKIELPSELFPSSPKIKSVGIGDLLVVKEKIKSYEAGEIAHIENVLKGEFKERSIRNLTRREDTFLIETEQTTETDQELNSSERFELQQESSKILQEEVNEKSGAGFSVSAGIKGAGIGFTYYVDGNVNGFIENSSKTATQNAEKKASNFAREVSNKAASRITERKREEQIRKVITEIEEINKHGIDNKKGSNHVIGIYQWIDKVYEAQVFNYGERMLFDFMVPEPAAFLRKASEKKINPIKGDPGDFTLRPYGNPRVNANESQEAADERAFGEAIKNYRVVGIKPLIPKHIWVAKEIKLQASDKIGDDDIFDAGKIIIPPGYRVEEIRVTSTAWRKDGADDAKLRITVADNYFGFMAIDEMAKVIKIVNANTGAESFTHLDGTKIDEPYAGGWGTFKGVKVVMPANEIITGEIAFSIASYLFRGISATIHILCTRTQEKYEEWRQQTYDTILQTYLNLKSDYEEKLAAAQFQEGVQISGRNPTENRKIEKTELKKSIISILSDEQSSNLTDKPFDDFNSIAVVNVNDGAGKKIYESHQVNVDESLKEGKIIRFFEQAFEWEHLMYVLYPYFWSRKATWLERILTEDIDPKHAEFLSAGSARVVLPVSENFEAAVTHFLETGNIPTDDEILDVNSPLYKPIVEEIKERQEAPGKEIAVGDPWEVRLPTALVKLRNDGSLPKWTKNAQGVWEPAN